MLSKRRRDARTQAVVDEGVEGTAILDGELPLHRNPSPKLYSLPFSVTQKSRLRETRSFHTRTRRITTKIRTYLSCVIFKSSVHKLTQLLYYIIIDDLQLFHNRPSLYYRTCILIILIRYFSQWVFIINKHCYKFFFH